MKKIVCLIISLLLIPVCVYADNPKVTSLKTEINNLTIKYSGTVETGSHAVMCKLFDKDNKEIDKLSSAVDNKKFSGSLLASSDGEYTLSCANYEGGEFKSVNLTINSNEKKDEANVKNPKTLDSIVKYAILMVISIIGFISAKLYFKKKIK